MFGTWIKDGFIRQGTRNNDPIRIWLMVVSTKQFFLASLNSAPKLVKVKLKELKGHDSSGWIASSSAVASTVFASLKEVPFSHMSFISRESLIDRCHSMLVRYAAPVVQKVLAIYIYLSYFLPGIINPTPRWWFGLPPLRSLQSCGGQGRPVADVTLHLCHALSIAGRKPFEGQVRFRGI